MTVNNDFYRVVVQFKLYQHLLPHTRLEHRVSHRPHLYGPRLCSAETCPTFQRHERKVVLLGGLRDHLCSGRGIKQ